MNYLRLHSWNVSPKEAVQIQRRLAPLVKTSGRKKTLHTIAGIDVSYNRKDPLLHAGVVVLSCEDLEVLEVSCASGTVTFPYVPGLLSFREIPVVLKAWRKLKVRPDCILCDGQGLAHPRRFGLACHLGLVLDLPSVGCAKSRLLGTYEEPGFSRGSRSPLWDRGEEIGAVLRTQDGVAPVFVSVGHKITLDRAIDLVLSTCRRYRLPEPIREAHRRVNERRRLEL
ncbi:MAG: deoxyribonuclease V [Candidatus Tectomicrobia bacterium]|uniref:Endonuclease V n=1 Tax=Tectimicrobiota bacterium TaxID=2528274 RepID=A0A932GQB9_UNCTE|nr:deoxyribonuclease V [Candidatus Tectomicrobia bacterium]